MSGNMGTTKICKIYNRSMLDPLYTVSYRDNKCTVQYPEKYEYVIIIIMIKKEPKYFEPTIGPGSP